jgi:hypothetical protein
MERAQIAIEVMPGKHEYGAVIRLARKHGVSRQTIYKIAQAGKDILDQGMGAGQHGRSVEGKAVLVTKDRLERAAVILTRFGVSQRDIPVCLEEMLDKSISSSWINAQLAQREAMAASVNQKWKPEINETLSGDEIYSNGSPNLLVMGNDSLYIYTLMRQPTCDGDTWGCVLLDSPATPQFASDAGTGLAAGTEAASIQNHQLDWDHLLRPMWGQAARLERQAYAALGAVEERAALLEQAKTEKRLTNHLKVWERLNADANRMMVQSDQFMRLAQQVDAQFALIDLETGQLREPSSAAAKLRSAGKQLSQWKGRIYAKLSANLMNWADNLFAYSPTLQKALLPWIEQWGNAAFQPLARLWQLETDAKRQPIPLANRSFHQSLWNHILDQSLAQLPIETLVHAWQSLNQVLTHSWRGSMLCECINSLLRPILASRKSSDQGCLELFRFLHNVHRFLRGKRSGFSPAELASIPLPADPLTLLGLAPKCQSNSLCF